MPGDKKDTQGKSSNIDSEKALFEKDIFSYRILKQTERLSAALYLVTSLIPEEEPLRGELRRLGLTVLSFIAEEGIYFKKEETYYPVLLAYISEILSFLTVSTVSGLISEMNREILDREYQKLLYILRERVEDISSQGKTFDSSFFDLSSEVSIPEETIQEPHPDTWGEEMWESIDKASYKGQPTSRRPISGGKEVHATTKAVPSRSTATLPRDSKGHISTTAERTARRSAIIELVRGQGRVSVKDVSRIIPSLSEKTLQRELLALVKEGILRKEGERRWSTYRLP